MNRNSTSSSTAATGVQCNKPVFGAVEPDLSTQVDSGTDRLVMRNIIYTAWSIFNSSNGSSGYSKWSVEKIAGGNGYLLLIKFGKGFRIGLHDMQALFVFCFCFVGFVPKEATAENVCCADSSRRVSLAHRLCVCAG